jgi:tetratricopeptide (TPR) repeat protein
MENMMPYTCRKLLFTLIAPAFLLAVLLSHAAAEGDEGVKDARKGTAAPSIAAGRAGKIDDEIEAARANVKADPSRASAHVRLGYLLVRKGAFDDAMLSFDEALKLNPRSHDAKTGKGVVLARKGDLQAAEQVLKDALLLNPNPVRTHYELGLVYEKLGDLEKAVAEFKEGIKKHEEGR